MRADLLALRATVLLGAFKGTDSSKDTNEVYGVLRPWFEGEATWNVYASRGSWEAAGVKGSLDRDPTVLGTIPPGTTGKQTITLNSGGISRVQSWVDSGQNNYGRIIANAANKDGLQFSSREATDAALRPMLEVTYTPPS